MDQRDFRQPLTIANRKHDVVCIQVYDRRIEELPDVGLMKVRDAETGFERFIDTGDRRMREAQHRWWRLRTEYLRDTFTRSNVDSVSVRTDQDYVSALMNLFAKRN